MKRPFPVELLNAPTPTGFDLVHDPPHGLILAFVEARPAREAKGKRQGSWDRVGRRGAERRAGFEAGLELGRSIA
jgi:hypothetical protein